MATSLSYLMGADEIADTELTALGIEIVGRSESGSRMLKIPETSYEPYVTLIRDKLTPGFWNEIVGADSIQFIFKFKDGRIEEYTLSSDTERTIDRLCAEFNDESPDTTANVYKYISENDFYHGFMVEHHADMINR